MGLVVTEKINGVTTERKEKNTMTIIQTIVTLFQLILAGVFIANIRREKPRTGKTVNLVSLALVAITIYTVWR